MKNQKIKANSKDSHNQRPTEEQCREPALNFNRKIRNRLLCLVLGVAAVVLIALAFATYHSSFELLLQVTEEKSKDEVEIAVQKIEQWIEERRSVVEVIAHVEDRNDLIEHEQSAYFLDVANDFGARAVYIGTESGQFVSSDNWQPPKDWDLRSRPWYQLASTSAKSVITQPYIDDSPPHQAVITIAMAMREKGELKGVVGIDATLDSVINAIDHLKIGKYSQAFLLYRAQGSTVNTIIGGDKRGEIKQDLLEQFLSTNEKIMSFVDSEYRVFARVADTDLIVVFHLPISEVHRSLQELTHIFIIGILAALTVLGFAVSLISTLIARPILSLAEGANQVASGNYDYRLDVSTRDEIGLVTHSFNDMAEGLKERELIRSTFGRYVSPEAVHEILQGKMELGGEKKLVTILFCDLRNFTSFAESCDPEQLVHLLNKYFTRMDKIIRGYGGSINRYLGDGILALFGAPSILENSAQASVEAALVMLEELETFNQEEGTSFQLGIGIHTGVGIVGNIGSEEHTEYTVIGNVANLASRIESLTKMYGEPILISEASASLVLAQNFDIKLIDKVRVSGKKESVVLYAPIEKGSLSPEIKASYKEIVESYLQGDFSTAIEQILALDDQFRSLHLELILARCQSFVEQGSAKWDGAFTLTTKG